MLVYQRATSAFPYFSHASHMFVIHVWEMLWRCKMSCWICEWRGQWGLGGRPFLLKLDHVPKKLGKDIISNYRHIEAWNCLRSFDGTVFLMLFFCDEHWSRLPPRTFVQFPANENDQFLRWNSGRTWASWMAQRQGLWRQQWLVSSLPFYCIKDQRKPNAS